VRVGASVPRHASGDRNLHPLSSALRHLTNTARPLRAVLEELIDRLGYRGAMDEARAVDAWPLVAGTTIAGVTVRAWMRERRLFVKVRSAPWRHQLHLQRDAWRDRLNHHLGGTVVREIVFC
jgi:hypothetical protein